MKKLLTLVVVLLFATVSFAANGNDGAISAKRKSGIKKSEQQVRTMNHLLYNKKKELGKLRSDRAQVPHDYEAGGNDEIIAEEDFDGAGTVWQKNGFLYAAGEGDTTTFNAFQGEGGEYSWWIGTNDPTYKQPGYGAHWGQYIQPIKSSYQLQSSLTSAAIRFDGFYNVEEGYDGVHLQVTSDGGKTWEYVACWSGESEGWIENVTVDVSDFIGEYITFRFVLLSDGGYDSQDGSVGGFENPGGFFFDNLEVVRNGVPELVSDGGDTKYNMFSDNLTNEFFADADSSSHFGSFFYKEIGITHDEYASKDSSLGFALSGTYPPGIDVLGYTGFYDFDVATTLLGNTAAPLWLDFNVYSTLYYESGDDAFAYWTPIAVTNTGNIYNLSDLVYVGEFGSDGDFVSYSDNYGYIDVSAFMDSVVAFGIEFASNGGCLVGTGSVYIDDIVVIQKNDPYEYNDFCDTATIIDYGFVSEFANIYDVDDVDYYYFEGTEGDWVDVYTDNSDVDLVTSLLPQVGAFNDVIDNSSCGSYMSAGRSCCEMFSWDDGEVYDRVIWRLPATGGYFVEVKSTSGSDIEPYVMYLDKLESAASITSITDLENDQGKVVTVEFTAPELDNYEDADFSRWGAHTVSFQVERKKNVISSEYDVVGQYEAFGLGADAQAYKVQVPTKTDSVGTYFRVKTKTGYVDYQGVGVEASADANGTSYDNIAPSFIAEYTLAPESGTGVDVGAEVDYGGGNDGVADIAFYNIYRGDAAGFAPSAANKIATVETHATELRYNDAEYDGSTEYYYVIEVVDDGGNKVMSKEVNTTTGVESEAVPTVYSLSQNYPNPFNPSTTIKFGIPQAADVTVKIFDILGQEVKTLVNRNLAAGFHTVNFDASSLISGMYIYRIQANGVDGSNFTDVKKMLLVK